MRPKQSLIKNEVSDLHLHLNGSLSLTFLEKLAGLYNRQDLIQQLVHARQAYAVKPEEIALGFKLFEWIHQIMSLGTLHECTDDETIFGSNARDENETVLRAFGYDQEDFSAGREHQSQFRFDC